MKEEGVYGRNDPAEEDTGVPTVRDENPDNLHPDHEKAVDEMRREKGREDSVDGTGKKEVASQPRKDIHDVAKTENDSDQVPS